MPIAPDYQLANERLYIRPLQPADAPALHTAAQSLPATPAHLIIFMDRLKSTVDAAEQFILAGQQTAALGVRYQLGVFQADGGNLIGNINVDVHAVLGVNLGYWCAADMQNKGFMTDALYALTDHLCHQPEIQRVEVQVTAENTPSRRVLEKNGFQFEGTRRNGAVLNGQVLDMHIYAHTPQSWDSFKTMQKAGLTGI